jgi:hypothetical protein
VKRITTTWVVSNSHQVAVSAVSAPGVVAMMLDQLRLKAIRGAVSREAVEIGHGLDLITCSPDGESRGLMFRVGDIFPMLPYRRLYSASAAPSSAARPWGLRFLVVPVPTAGKHEGPTKPTSNSPDGNGPEEVGQGVRGASYRRRRAGAYRQPRRGQ